ncbi:hypothetical protein EVAR_28696_1 [Eumeta japonica]|uniref:Uncharacterized protein n=1 Tax=Eumeta variegata TaxID=151549 RepID=A0A4C1V449_EUMVA|nr:hypothetical protein EVAR_28696_1 [Eumeta japonica]
MDGALKGAASTASCDETSPGALRTRSRRFVIKINSISKLVQTNYTTVPVCVPVVLCAGNKKTASEILAIKINRSGEKAPRGATTGRAGVGGGRATPPRPRAVHAPASSPSS